MTSVRASFKRSRVIPLHIWLWVTLSPMAIALIVYLPSNNLVAGLISLVVGWSTAAVLIALRVREVNRFLDTLERIEDPRQYSSPSDLRYVDLDREVPALGDENDANAAFFTMVMKHGPGAMTQMGEDLWAVEFGDESWVGKTPLEALRLAQQSLEQAD